MKPYVTNIDTIKLQLDFKSQEQQHVTLNEIISYISMRYHINYKDFTNEFTRQVNRVFFVYYKGTYICSISAGIYVSYDKNKFPRHVYYISIKFAGLKRYNDSVDDASEECLFRLCAFVNTKRLTFKVTQLDIALDIYAKFNQVLAVCTKRTASTKYYSLSEQQTFKNTRYVEKIAYDRLYKVSKHAYTYDKAHKEGLDFDLTRFELSLNPKFLSKNGLHIHSIAKALDRYHVMYFPTIKEKDSKISTYESYTNFRYRDVKKVGFDAYRLYPNLDYINEFLLFLFKIELSHFDDDYLLNEM